MPSPPATPRDLKVERDLGGLRYTATTWERVRWQLLAALLLPLLAFVSLAALSDILVDSGYPALADVFSLLSGLMALLTMFQPLPLLLILLVFRWLVQVEVSIDQVGITMVRRRQTERLLWASCEDIRRRGRLIEVAVQGRWLPLPSPRTYPDAIWLEDVVRTSIDARQDDATAPPAEIAQALRALTGRIPS